MSESVRKIHMHAKDREPSAMQCIQSQQCARRAALGVCYERQILKIAQANHQQILALAPREAYCSVCGLEGSVLRGSSRRSLMSWSQLMKNMLDNVRIKAM
jgi:hypothetical protein